MKPGKPRPGKPGEDSRAKARRAAVNALRRARRAAARAGVELSEWEGEFMTSVEGRLELYGRAFGDPEKGAAGEALSALQRIKLKEITTKVLGGDVRGGKSPPRAKFARKLKFPRKVAAPEEPIPPGSPKP